MTLFDYVQMCYQFEEGPAGALAVRRKTVAALSIFGRGKATSEDPFKPLSERLGDIERHIRSDYGPASRRAIVQAMHDASEVQFKTEAVNRRNR